MLHSNGGPIGRLMMIGLDGCELSIAERMMAAGRLPTLSKMVAESARCLLDHGGAKNTGLAWEHVASGLEPDDAERFAAVDFDPKSYQVRQRPTNLTPFVASVDARTVVFDAPYFDLQKTPRARGLVSWGAHDPGVEPFCRPSELAAEMRERFGKYAAPEWIYGFVWPSEERADRMAKALIRATEQRAAATSWLFKERLPDWELGLVVVSEFHSAVEALWHGIDPTHPLHRIPSSRAAREGIEGVYEACDRMIADLMSAFPDATFVVFNLHGMGPNNSDVTSMALLPELLYRREFGRPLMHQRKWLTTSAGVPLLESTQDWAAEVGRLYQRNTIATRLIKRARRALGIQSKKVPAKKPPAPLDWMPATRYREHWPRMRAFALPSYYDGRVRINLKGREAQGMVDVESYQSTCDEIITLLRECRDPLSGEPAVESVEQRTRANPLDLHESDADLVVRWSMVAPLALTHPRVGTVGPLPYRRTGGHTGEHGFAFFKGPTITPGDIGRRSAFDVVPTVLDLLSIDRTVRVSGHSLASASPS